MVLVSGINCTTDMSGDFIYFRGQTVSHTLHQFVRILKRWVAAFILIELKKISYWGNIFFNSGTYWLKKAAKGAGLACPKLSFAGV